MSLPASSLQFALQAAGGFKHKAREALYQDNIVDKVSQSEKFSLVSERKFVLAGTPPA